jgi:hypothetical protein
MMSVILRTVQAEGSIEKASDVPFGTTLLFDRTVRSVWALG